jgi:VWFA-related protein
MIRQPPWPALLLMLGQAASGPGQDRPSPPVFATRTDLVLVDFVVLDKSDRVVTGLTAQDFVVKEDGKVRPIASFKAFAPGEPEADAGPDEVIVEPYPTAAPAPAPRPPAAAAVIFVDDGQMSPAEAVRLKPALKKLIETLAERNGALVLLAPWSKISLAELVEGNRATFFAAVDRIRGRRVEDYSSFPIADAEAIAIQRGDAMMLARVTARFIALNPGMDGNSAGVTATSRATEVYHDARIRREDAYGVLLQSLDWLVRQPGRHSVVMVSGGFAYDSNDTRKQQEVVTRSLLANAPIHFIDSRGLQGMGRYQGVEYGPALDRDAGETPFAFSEAAEGSSNLADDTGGLTIRNTNDVSKGLTRLLDMTSTYYLLGYEPPEHKKPGFRKIKLEMLKKGYRVIARRGYFDETSSAR